MWQLWEGQVAIRQEVKTWLWVAVVFLFGCRQCKAEAPWTLESFGNVFLPHILFYYRSSPHHYVHSSRVLRTKYKFFSFQKIHTSPPCTLCSVSTFWKTFSISLMHFRFSIFRYFSSIPSLAAPLLSSVQTNPAGSLLSPNVLIPPPFSFAFLVHRLKFGKRKLFPF